MGHKKTLGWGLMKLSCAVTYFPGSSFDDTLCYLSKVLCDSTKHLYDASLRDNREMRCFYQSIMRAAICTEQEWQGRCCPARFHTCCFANIFSFISNSIFSCLSRRAAFLMIVAIVISFWWSSSVRSEISFLILSCSQPWCSSSWQRWLLICGR